MCVAGIRDVAAEGLNDCLHPIEKGRERLLAEAGNPNKHRRTALIDHIHANLDTETERGEFDGRRFHVGWVKKQNFSAHQIQYWFNHVSLLFQTMCGFQDRLETMLGQPPDRWNGDAVAHQVVGRDIVAGQLVVSDKPISRAASRVERRRVRTVSPSTTMMSWMLDPPPLAIRRHPATSSKRTSTRWTLSATLVAHALGVAADPALAIAQGSPLSRLELGEVHRSHHRNQPVCLALAAPGDAGRRVLDNVGQGHVARRRRRQVEPDRRVLALR